MTHQAALYDLLVHANNLKQLPRTGWLLAGVVQPESVAEHCFATALLALQLGEVINQDWRAEALEKPLDLGQVMRIALIHDLAESELTDLPHRSTELIGKEAKHRAEETAMGSMVDKLPNREQILMTWRDYAQKKSPEARLVKDADRLEMVFQSHVYTKRGHANLAEFQEGHTWHFRASQAFFEEIIARKS